MKPHRLLVLGVLLAACADAPLETADVGGPQQGVVLDVDLEGTVRGPGNVDICGFFTGGAEKVVLLYDLGVNPVRLEAQVPVHCPGGTWSARLPAGRYAAVFRASEAHDETEPALLTTYLDTIPIVLTTPTSRILKVPRGVPTAGTVKIAGEPHRSHRLRLRLQLEGRTIHTATLVSGADGRWTMNNQAAYLQRGVAVAWDCGDAPLGSIPTGANEGAFVASGTSRTLNCVFGNSIAGQQLTHRSGNLFVTAFPGRFGLGSPIDAFGRGYGVQLNGAPNPSRYPSSNQLFRGGLALAVEGEILSGVDLTGYNLHCGAGCVNDFTFDGRRVTTPGGRRRVQYDYTAQGSDPAVSLSIRQVSWEAPGRFVVVRYVIRNTSPRGVVIHPGLFMDWDVGSIANNDIGDTERQGRLMYVSDDITGLYYGTLIIGREAAGNYMRTETASAMTQAQQVAALTGGMRSETAGPADIHYFHGALGRRVGPNKTTTFYTALVAGTTLGELRAAANSAEAFVDALAGGS